jgi:threonine dehydrogenase-like Zn-dependent dehydrogenase
MQSHCLNGGGYEGCQAQAIRIPNADGTLIATPEHPDDDLIPGLLALSDVMATGWHAAVSANVRPGGTVVVRGRRRPSDCVAFSRPRSSEPTASSP